jgi:hypothetical protein
MEANELRIGNWINDIMGGFCQITADDIANWEAINAQPIPLTPEILEKSGFQWEVSDHKPQCEKNGVLFFLYEDGSIGVGGWVYSDYIEIGNANARYLHQLQNLYFALTGEELEIKI